MEKTKAILLKLGAEGLSEAFGSMDGRAAFMLAFSIGGEQFKIVWPVLPVKRPEDQSAARIQAATLLYHDCKAKALSAAILGARAAFFYALVTKDGRTMAQVANPNLADFPTLKIGYG